ncbi:MAG: hypothetical protein ABSG63_00170 [Spirochaetia bacterium]|jgi:hypothetical protein
MKKLLIAVSLFAAAAGTLSANAIWLFGGGVGYTNQATAGGHPWSASSLGLMVNSYFDVNGSLGVYSAATIGFMAGAQDNGTTLNVAQYQNIGLNILLGVGYRMPLTPGLTAIGGAGMYLGSATLAANNQTLSSYFAGGFGAGIGLSLLYAISMNWGIGVNINAAYSFANPGDVAPTMSPQGIGIFGGIGVTYFAYPVLEVPTYSRLKAVTTTR